MSTESVKRSLLNTLVSHGFDLDSVSQADVRDVEERIGWSESTFKTALGYLGKPHGNLYCPIRDYMPTDEETAQIEEAFGAFGKLLVFLGCRFSAMWGLSIDPQVDVLRVPAQKKGDQIRISLKHAPGSILMAARRWVNIEMRQTTPRKIRYHWQKLVEEGKISERCTPHAFRHKLVTELLEGGVDPVFVAKSVGHKSTTTTMRYVHLSPAKQAEYRTKRRPQRESTQVAK